MRQPVSFNQFPYNHYNFLASLSWIEKQLRKKWYLLYRHNKTYYTLPIK